MKSWKKFGALVVPMALSMTFPALAGQWEKADVTWKYQQDDGSYAADTWQWIDSNGDGLAECYHFNENGFLDLDTVVDNWVVNSKGEWTWGGNPQQLDLKATADEIGTIYRAASQKADSLDDFDADFDAVMTMTIDGESLKMLMDMDMQMKGAKSGNMIFLCDMAVAAEGESVTMTMFYKDGYMYMAMDDLKMAMPMDMDEMIEETMSLTSKLQVASDEMYGMTNLKMYHNGDAKTVTYDMDAAELNKAVNEVMALMGNDYSGLGYEYQVNRASGTIHINKNGYVDEESVSMDMSMDVMGIPINMTVDMDIVFNNPGQPVYITLPSTEGYRNVADLFV